MEFKNEEATGPGVLREWFFMVCQAVFNPQNALYVACPNDCRRFFPNPASEVDPLHLEYFSFSGRVIALALMHKVQVGIVFDRVLCFSCNWLERMFLWKIFMMQIHACTTVARKSWKWMLRCWILMHWF